MGGFLRQSTNSQSRSIGPFVDETDGKTAETGLTIGNTDIKLIVNGGASANKNSGGGTHRANGHYGVTFDATDTATVGELTVSVVVAGALPVWDKFTVVEEAVYDRDYATAAPGYVDGATVNATAISNSSTTADRLELTMTSSPTGTVDDAGFSPTSTEFEASDITEATADHYNGRSIIWTSGALQGQAAYITDYVLSGGRGHFTVTPMTEAPADGAAFIIV